MNDGKDKDKAAPRGLTSGISDAEAGGPGGSRPEEIDQELAALEKMYQRGLIGDGTYNTRRSELEAERGQYGDA